jgi:RNA polymerase sigma-70 factor (ECF subfamily)
MGRSDSSCAATGFSELVDAHHAALYAFTRRRLADRDSVEDVLADTFLVAWRRRDEIPDPPLPWLYGVCLRTISTHRRSARRRTRLWSRLASQPHELARDPADLHAERSQIDRAFARLSEREREVLRLVAWEGLSSAEAATALGVTPSAFRVRLHRARRALAKHLATDGHEGLMAGNDAQAEVAG